MKIKTLFLDIDGTLLNRAHILTENTKEILDDAIVILKLDGKIVERENKLFA